MRYGTSLGPVIAAGVLWSLQALIFRQIAEAGSWAVMVCRSLGTVLVLLDFVVWRAGGSPWSALRRVVSARFLGTFRLISALKAATTV